MLKLFLRTGKQMLVAVLCISCCAMIGCVEASLQLASESRLPKWITIPPGLTRADVSVTMNDMNRGGGRGTEFITKDKNGRVLAKTRGALRGLHPIHLNGPLKVDHRYQYPLYEVVTVNGVTEIVEQKKPEPLFYVSDDPAVRKELLGDKPKEN